MTIWQHCCLFLVMPAGVGLGPWGLKCHPLFLFTCQSVPVWAKASCSDLGSCDVPKAPLPALARIRMERCGVSRYELCLLHPCAPSATSQGTWMMPVPLPAETSLSHPPALSSLRCPLASHSLAQPLWALPSPLSLSPHAPPEPWLPVLETWCRPLPRHVPVLSACLLLSACPHGATGLPCPWQPPGAQGPCGPPSAGSCERRGLEGPGRGR